MQKETRKKLLIREKEYGVVRDVFLKIHFNALPNMSPSSLCRAVSPGFPRIIVEPVVRAVAPERAVARRDSDASSDMPLDCG